MGPYRRGAFHFWGEFEPTIEPLRSLRALNTLNFLDLEESFFIIGGDSRQDLPDWYRPRELVRHCRLTVAQRPGYRPNLSDLETVVPGLAWVETPLLEIAGSAIWERVRQGQSIRYQVPEPVRGYIDRAGRLTSDNL